MWKAHEQRYQIYDVEKQKHLHEYLIEYFVINLLNVIPENDILAL